MKIQLMLIKSKTALIKKEGKEKKKVKQEIKKEKKWSKCKINEFVKWNILIK